MSDIFLEANNFEKNFNLNIFQNRDKLLVALSGGADSTACLYFLKNTFPDMCISALYINHGLRLEAEDEELFCKKICKSLDISYYSDNYDIKKEAKFLKKSIEETGRIIRYRVLLEKAEKIKANKIVTAHHLNDQTESILLQFFSGTSGMNIGICERMQLSEKVEVVRPMLKILKKDIYGYLEENDIDYKVDRSNYESEYDRNKLRNIIIPQIKELINPGLESTITHFKEVSDNASDFISKTVAKTIRDCYIKESGHYILSKLLKKHSYIQRECIKTLIINDNRYIGRITSEFLGHIIQFLTSESANSRFVLSKGFVLIKSYNEFYFDIMKEKSLNLPFFLKKGVNYIGEKKLIIQDTNTNKFLKKNNMKIRLDKETIDIKSLQCRYRLPGDDFIPLGMAHPKKIKNYFIDKKVPLSERDETLLVMDKEKIIWIVGHEIDDRVKITPESKSYIEMICE